MTAAQTKTPLRDAIAFTFAGERLVATSTGALWWEARRLLCISDLHLGKSERLARRGGALAPPYETRDTIHRLREDITRFAPETVICLGDSFDDLGAAANLDGEMRSDLASLVSAHDWIWIEGNHDNGPNGHGGRHCAELAIGALAFRHIARGEAQAEVSGHYHPKASFGLRGLHVSRPCFLCDDRRIVMPAYGTYTGGLRSTDTTLCALMAENARAILLGRPPVVIPMPRRR
jgi:DNA ligase-associated metallophosphoesterase